MINILLGIIVTFSGVFSAIYLLYFIFVLHVSKKIEYIKELEKIIENEVNFENLPLVTIIIPAYNEERIIYSKIKNISELNYPKNKIEVLVVDDHSTDNTREMADKALKDFSLKGMVIQNKTRKGVNASYNCAINQAVGEYVLTTDADAILPSDILLKTVKIMRTLDDVGAVAAKMLPIYNEITPSTKISNTYINLYDTMLLSESAIASTFPGSTSCMMIRKSAFSPITAFYGSSDGNISLSIIRKGFRVLLVPSIVYYEPLPQKFSAQVKQKIRRATRLIQSMLLNVDMLFVKKYGTFGRVIFPLRLLMMTLCPVLALSSFFLLIFILHIVSPIFLCALLLGLALIITLGMTSNSKLPNSITTFFIHQIYLFIGLIQCYRKLSIWQSIERS